MACRIFSSLENAKENIKEFCLRIEQDVFIIRTDYPSGSEFAFRLRNEITFIDSKRIEGRYKIPRRHKFKSGKAAEMCAGILQAEKDKPFGVEDVTYHDEKYRIDRVSHYKVVELTKSKLKEYV